ncbi:phage tail tape measure protein [Pseudomonas oryzihabitans]|uniref:phage tail tape measure protein n=1 Tax=Pseudomonas oryzihabitans TaxID=47885 RepID=UPI0011A543CF|nr:phage tail tape measure protein [Pseudomonas oryzihabitans]
MTNIAQLGIRVESESVDTAATDLDRLVQAGTRTNAELAALNLKSREATRSLSDMAQRQRESATSLAQIAKAAVTVNHELQSLGLKQTYVAESMSDMALSSRQTVEQLELLNSRQQQSVQSMTNLGSAVDRSSAEFRAAAASLREMTAQLQALAVTAPKTIPPLKSQKEQLAQLLGQIDPTIAALDRLDAQQRKLQSFKAKGLIDAETFERFNGQLQQTRTGLTDFDSGLTRTGNTAKQTAAALRNVPAQFTDIVVSLQAGQAPLTVLLQQGGQLKDMFGGIGPAASALGGYVLGLVNPFTVAAGAAAVLGVALVQAQSRANDLNAALISTGNQAGATSDDLTQMINRLAGGKDFSQARTAVLALAGDGRATVEVFEQVARAATQMAAVTGQGADEIAKKLIGAKDKVTDLAVELNSRYHFMSASVFDYIAALEDQGDSMGALRVLAEQLGDVMQQRNKQMEESTRGLAKVWNDLKRTVLSTYEQIQEKLAASPEQFALDVVRGQIADLQKLGDSPFNRKIMAQYKDREKALLDQVEAKKKDANATSDGQAKEQELVTNRNKWREDAKKYYSDEKKLEEQIKSIREEGLKAGASQAEIDARIAFAREQAAKKNRTRTPRTAVNLTDLNEEQNARKALVSSYANSQKELEAQQKAGLITQEAYYRQRVVLINAEKEQVTAAYQSEIDALEQAKARSTTSAEQRIQLDQKIADARASMVKAQRDADTELSVLALNEQGRLKKQEESVRTYTDALQQQVTTLREQGQRAAATLGMGDRQQSLYASQNAITDRFNTSRRELADQYADGSRGMSLEEYQRKLEALRVTENDMRDTVVKNYDDMTAAQGDWRNGASSAWHNYLEDAQNVAGQAKTAFTSLYDGMTDAVVEWAAGSDRKFGDVAASFAKMIAKMALQASVSSVWTSIFGAAVTVGGAAAGGTTTSGFTYGLGSASAGLTYGGGRAVGGQVSGGSFYQVNEKGPELLNQGGKSYLMMGGDGGSITPLTSGSSAASAAGGAARSIEVTVVVNSDGSVETKTNEQSWKSMGDEIGRFVDARIRENEARSLSSQGNIRRAINGRA